MTTKGAGGTEPKDKGRAGLRPSASKEEGPGDPQTDRDRTASPL